MALYTPIDKYQARISWEIGRFRTWAGPTTKLHIGEFNVALGNASGNYSGYELNQFVQAGTFGVARMNKENIHFSAWAGGSWWGAYNLLVSNGSTTTALNQVYSSSYTRNGLFGGINWAGPEFAHEDTIESPNLSFQGSYPSQAQMNHMSALGITAIRIPFRWERMQSSLGGALRASEVAVMNNALDYAEVSGVKVILDVHNYALIHTSGGDKTLDDSTTRNHYFDFLDKLYDEFGSHNAFYAVDIMNEPSQVTWENWETYSQDAVTYLRNAGHTQRIIVELGNWAGIQELDYKHSGGPWITDTADNTMYSGHYYPDYTNQNRGNFTTPTSVNYSGEVNASPKSIADGTFEWDGTTEGDFGSEIIPDPTYSLSFDAPAWVKGYSEYVPPTDITVSNTTQADSTGYQNTKTISHDSDTDFLAVHIATRNVGDLVSVTYDGVALTKIVQSPTSTNAGTVAYYLDNPSSGVNDLVVTFSAYRLFSVFAMSVDGVDVGNSINSSLAGVEAYSTSDLQTLSNVPEGAMVVSSINLKTNQALTPDPNQTEQSDTGHSDANLGQHGVSTYVTSGIENVGMSWSWASSDNVFQVVYSLNPTSSGASEIVFDGPAYIEGVEVAGEISFDGSASIVGTASGGGGSATVEQTKEANSGGYNNTFNFSFDSSVTTGNSIIFTYGGEQDGDIITVTDNQSNTYVKAVADESTDGRGEVWYAENVTGGTVTITITLQSGIYNYGTVVAVEVSGLETSSSLDVTASDTDVSYVTSHGTGTTATTSQADEFVVAGYGGKGTGTASNSATGYTLAGEESATSTHATLLYKTVSSTGTQTATIGSTIEANGAGLIATFKIASGVVSPDVETGSATSITDTTATLAGNIIATGGANATVRGVCYGLSADPDTGDSVVNESGSYGTGGFSLGVTGLTAGTTYHYRAYATNSNGTSYGDDETFETTAPIVVPIVSRPIERPKVKKSYTLKVFDKDGTTQKDVIPLVSEISFQARVNGGLGSLELKLPDKFDDSSIDLLDSIQVWVQDSSSSARKIYSGYIDYIDSEIRQNGEDKTLFAVGYSARLAYTLDWNGTSITQTRNSQDPGVSVKDVIDDYRSNVSDEQIDYDGSSVTNLGSNVSYESNNKMCTESIERFREMSGEDYYWYVDAENLFSFKPYSTTPDHFFTLGTNLSSVKKSVSFNESINKLLFWNSITDSGDPEYIQKMYYSATAVSSHWDKYSKITDSRYSDSAEADKLGTAFIEANKDPNIGLVLEVIDDEYGLGYDIESIQPGQTCRILNTSDSDLYNNVLRITGVDYLGTSAFIYVQDKRSLTSRGLNEIRRTLDTTVYTDNPGVITLDDVD